MKDFIVGGINQLSTIDADGLACVIYFQGCSRGCPGCHNLELQSFECGTPTSMDRLLNRISTYHGWYKAVVFQGGEPLEQPLFELITLADSIRNLFGLKVWLYTGYNYDDVPDVVKEHFDVIKAGAYIEELKTGGFPASSNQKVYRRDTNV
jgi:anaerobic ribonucleoside-triphosphate reductase activating protein